MDISVKLNLSYPAPIAQDALTAKSQSILTSETLDRPGKPDRNELEKVVRELQDYVQAGKRQLDFSIDDTTGQVVVKVIASESGDVVRQIPSEAALKLAQSLRSGGSLLFDGEA